MLPWSKFEFDAQKQLMPTFFYLVRHGQSTWNELGRIQGKQDPPLSTLGLRQSQVLTNALQYKPITAFYSSPQQRARMTAQAIATVHNLPVQIVETLAEIDHGHWEGLTESEIQQRFTRSFRMWMTRPSQTQMPGGEHCAAVQKRVLEAWRNIVVRHDGEHVLIVSHDIPIKIIIADVLRLALDQIGRFIINNAAVNVIQKTGDQLRLVQLNGQCHLTKLPEEHHLASQYHLLTK